MNLRVRSSVNFRYDPERLLIVSLYQFLVFTHVRKQK